MRDRTPLGSTVVAATIRRDGSMNRHALGKVEQDRLVSDLKQLLKRVDALGLGMAGIHLSTAIDAIRTASVRA